MKKLYIILAAIIDAVLLAVILKSYFAEKNGQSPTAQNAAGSSVSQSAGRRTAQTESPQSRTDAPAAGSGTQQTDALTGTDDAPAVTTKGSSGGKKNYSTDASAQYADMSETFLNGSSGFVWQNLTADAAALTDFDAVQGGWKAYIVSSPDDIEHSVTYLMNLKLSGTAEQVTVTLDWDYFYANHSGDEGNSSEPDSVYTGPWTSAGTVYAEGAGAVSLFDFREQDGRQYGLGTVFWPDRTYGAIALVRP